MSDLNTCNLCGESRKMTREHLPPKGSYGPSGSRVEIQNLDQYVDGRRGRIYQGGYFERVLCEDCNNLTGSAYGNDFARWSQWGHSVLASIRRNRAEPFSMFEGYPLRVAKQILATLVASATPALTAERRDVRRLLLEPQSTAPRGSIDLHAYFCVSAHGRSTGVATAMKPGTAPHVVVESSLPPFGYLWTLSGQPHDPRPLDISWFLECEYDAMVEFELSGMPLLPTFEPFPGDFRTKDEIRRDVIQNILVELQDPTPRDEADRMMEDGDARTFLEEHGEVWDSWSAS